MGKDAPSHAPERSDEALRAAEDEPVRCLACAHVLSRRSSRMERDGKHRHSFLNPAGIPFVVCLYREANGCVPHGARETYFTWFPGHAWQIALCGGCQAHVGWSFHGDPPDARDAVFHALVADRIVG